MTIVPSYRQSRTLGRTSHLMGTAVGAPPVDRRGRMRLETYRYIERKIPMTRDTAKKFWKEHIKLACAGGSHLPIPNPADTFNALAYSGGFDSLSDEDYEEKLKDAREISSFWNSHRETVGNVLKDALARTDISDKDIARIAGILASASVRSDYDTEGQNEKRLDGDHFSPDGRDINMDMTPEQLVRQVKQTVIGQDNYIQDICTAVWMHSLRYTHFIRTGEAISHPKHNVLCLGRSGTGKTLAIQTLGKILDIPVLIEDASSLRGSGWKGNSVSSMIPRIIELSGNDGDKARFTIVCLDEFDKIFQCQVTDKSFSPVNNLLTFMGGALITHSESNNNTASLDTSDLLFICLGAFDGLKEIIQKRLSGRSGIGFGSDGYREPPEKDIFQLATKDDLSQYGIPWEMLGRLSLITTTKDRSIEDLKHILTSSEMSPIKQHDDLLHRSIHAHVGISDAAASHIAQIAHDSHMGAREMGRIVSEALMPAIYNIGNDNSVAGITLDVGQDGLFVSYQKGARPVPSPKEQADSQEDRPGMLTEIDLDILQSVPFSCKTDQNSIIDYTMEIYNASEKVSWRPISQIHPKPLLASAMCILTASICTQLMNVENQNPTMYDLITVADSLSPAMVAYNPSVQPLNLMRQEFMGKALENSVNSSKAAEITKHMIRQYAHQRSYEAKYNRT